MEEELKKYRTDNPKLTEQFADLKRKLGDVNEDEWNSIPEIGDYTVKKRPRMESFVPVPDTLLARAAEEKKSTSAVLDAQPGLSTPASGLQTNLTEVSHRSRGHFRSTFGPSVSGPCSRRPSGSRETSVLHWVPGQDRAPSLQTGERPDQCLHLGLQGCQLLASVQNRLLFSMHCPSFLDALAQAPAWLCRLAPAGAQS